MNIMRKYAIYAIEILKDCLPIIPVVQITEAKTYAGRCIVEKIKSQNRIVKATIRLSSYCHMDVPCLMTYEDHLDIIDTIAHELAHVFIISHCKEHTELTNDFKNLIIKYFEQLGFLNKKSA
jgi:hypothetical protein